MHKSSRRTYLKALGAGALATGIAGVAGCLGAEAEGTGGCIDASSVDTSQFDTYTNTKDGGGYSINYPAGWRISDDYAQQAYFEPKEPEKDEITGTLLVTVEKAAGKTADGLVEAELEKTKENSFDDVEIHCQKEVTLSSGQTGSFASYDAFGGARYILLVVIENGTSYTIEADLVMTETSVPKTTRHLTAAVESFALTRK
jgi:hypothetical protein